MVLCARYWICPASYSNMTLGTASRSDHFLSNVRKDLLLFFSFSSFPFALSLSLFLLPASLYAPSSFQYDAACVDIASASTNINTSLWGEYWTSSVPISGRLRSCSAAGQLHHWCVAYFDHRLCTSLEAVLLQWFQKRRSCYPICLSLMQLVPLWLRDAYLAHLFVPGMNGRGKPWASVISAVGSGGHVNRSGGLYDGDRHHISDPGPSQRIRHMNK
jgi:hypothetical protein